MIGLFHTSNIINDSNIKKLIRLYAREDNWHNLDKDTANLGYGWLHYAFIRNMRPSRILCIGSKYGLIPAVCALACKDNHKGIVDFVDAGLDQKALDTNHWGGVGMWKETNPLSRFQPFQILDHIKLYVMTSKQFAEKYSKRNWEYVHIDGDHSYQGVTYDFNTFWPRLTKGGYMAIHDIHTPDTFGNLEYGVRQFWQELKNGNKFHYFEYPGPCGLGMIQK